MKLDISTNTRWLSSLVFTGAILSTAQAQIPDVLNAFDAGSRSLGAGGAMGVTGADTLSIFNNPAALGFMSSRTLGLAYRNLSESETQVGGNFASPVLSTSQQRGGNAVSHLGYVMPMSGLKKGAEGTLGVAYTVGGYINDFRSGNNLQVGNLTLNNYEERLEARADFLTVSYGRTNLNQNLSWGFGLNVVNQKINNTVSGTLNNNTPFNPTDVSETGTGIGLVAGMQYIPTNRPNTSFGLSIRTPINLNGNSTTSVIYDTIPGVISLGAAIRRDNVRNSEDFVVFGSQINHFFGGVGSGPLDRSNQTTFGLGVEYNKVNDSAIIPIRFGYIAVPAGGTGFLDRSAFTLGIGYRPKNSPYSLDLNYAFPRTGNSDVALFLTYRFDK